MCLIISNTLVRVSHRMVSFSELLPHFNFHPDSDLVFLLRTFSLLTWWDCNLLCWSRTSWHVRVWVTIKVVFSTIFIYVQSALVPWTDITLKKKKWINKPSSSQFCHRTKRGLIILHGGECYFRQWLPVSSRRTSSRKTHRGCVQRRHGTYGKRTITFSFTVFFLPLIKRRCRRCLNSLLLWSRNFATMVTWRHTSFLCRSPK